MNLNTKLTIAIPVYKGREFIYELINKLQSSYSTSDFL